MPPSAEVETALAEAAALTAAAHEVLSSPRSGRKVPEQMKEEIVQEARRLRSAAASPVGSESDGELGAVSGQPHADDFVDAGLRALGVGVGGEEIDSPASGERSGYGSRGLRDALLKAFATDGGTRDSEDAGDPDDKSRLWQGGDEQSKRLHGAAAAVDDILVSLKECIAVVWGDVLQEMERQEMEGQDYTQLDESSATRRFSARMTALQGVPADHDLVIDKEDAVSVRRLLPYVFRRARRLQAELFSQAQCTTLWNTLLSKKDQQLVLVMKREVAQVHMLRQKLAQTEQAFQRQMELQQQKVEESSGTKLYNSELLIEIQKEQQALVHQFKGHTPVPEKTDLERKLMKAQIAEDKQRIHIERLHQKVRELTEAVGLKGKELQAAIEAITLDSDERVTALTERFKNIRNACSVPQQCLHDIRNGLKGLKATLMRMKKEGMSEARESALHLEVSITKMAGQLRTQPAGGEPQDLPLETNLNSHHKQAYNHTDWCEMEKGHVGEPPPLSIELVRIDLALRPIMRMCRVKPRVRPSDGPPCTEKGMMGLCRCLQLDIGDTVALLRQKVRDKFVQPGVESKLALWQLDSLKHCSQPKWDVAELKSLALHAVEKARPQGAVQALQQAFDDFEYAAISGQCETAPGLPSMPSQPRDGLSELNFHMTPLTTPQTVPQKRGAKSTTSSAPTPDDEHPAALPGGKAVKTAAKGIQCDLGPRVARGQQPGTPSTPTSPRNAPLSVKAPRSPGSPSSPKNFGLAGTPGRSGPPALTVSPEGVGGQQGPHPRSPGAAPPLLPGSAAGEQAKQPREDRPPDALWKRVKSEVVGGLNNMVKELIDSRPVDTSHLSETEKVVEQELQEEVDMMASISKLVEGMFSQMKSRKLNADDEKKLATIQKHVEALINNFKQGVLTASSPVQSPRVAGVFQSALRKTYAHQQKMHSKWITKKQEIQQQRMALFGAVVRLAEGDGEEEAAPAQGSSPAPTSGPGIAPPLAARGPAGPQLQIGSATDGRAAGTFPQRSPRDIIEARPKSYSSVLSRASATSGQGRMRTAGQAMMMLGGLSGGITGGMVRGASSAALLGQVPVVSVDPSALIPQQASPAASLGFGIDTGRSASPEPDGDGYARATAEELPRTSSRERMQELLMRKASGLPGDMRLKSVARQRREAHSQRLQKGLVSSTEHRPAEKLEMDLKPSYQAQGLRSTSVSSAQGKGTPPQQRDEAQAPPVARSASLGSAPDAAIVAGRRGTGGTAGRRGTGGTAGQRSSLAEAAAETPPPGHAAGLAALLPDLPDLPNVDELSSSESEEYDDGLGHIAPIPAHRARPADDFAGEADPRLLELMQRQQQQRQQQQQQQQQQQLQQNRSGLPSAHPDITVSPNITPGDTSLGVSRGRQPPPTPATTADLLGLSPGLPALDPSMLSRTQHIGVRHPTAVFRIANAAKQAAQRLKTAVKSAELAPPGPGISRVQTFRGPSSGGMELYGGALPVRAGAADRQMADDAGRAKKALPGLGNTSPGGRRRSATHGPGRATQRAV